jgi:hypothetical protein
MKIQILNLNCSPWTTATVAVLRALHRWSKRNYRRELLRRELRRIGREMGNAECRMKNGEVSGQKAEGGARNMNPDIGCRVGHSTSNIEWRMARR